MRTLKRTILALSIAALLPAAALRADTAPATAPAPAAHKHPHAKANKRLHHQEKRIEAGKKDGSLTKGEAAGLRKDERNIHQQEQDMRKLDDGKLTKSDKQTLNQEQNAESKKIYDDRHNDVTTTPK